MLSQPSRSRASASASASSVAELINEIATLEVEIMNLEHHLLSLYRIAFEGLLPNMLSSSTDMVSKCYLHCEDGLTQKCIPNSLCRHKDANVQSFSKKTVMPLGAASVCAFTGPDGHEYSPSTKRTSKRDLKNAGSGLNRIANLLDAHTIERVVETPNNLSQDIVICMSSIYCKFSKPSPPLIDSSFSPMSSFSSSVLPENHSDNWSPQCVVEAAVHPFLPEGLKKKSPVDAETIDILEICLDDDSFNYAAKMLQKFRSLVHCLEEVDPSKMKHEEKLAFWINIHNALVMHAHLAYGTRHNHKKLARFIQKAAYNVGGHCINPFVIRCAILGCDPHQLTPWPRMFVSSRVKPRSRSPRHIYALDRPEPLVHFALCYGAYSDPVVKTYEAKTVIEELNLGKHECIEAKVSIKRERNKVLLPKVLNYFAKDACLNLFRLMELVQACVPEAQREAISRCLRGKPADKHIEWIPYDPAFQYRIQIDKLFV
ncbi:hypothetical protein Sjap_009615 [Stephania japonica]|uniref:DUF547 domain-containing protein n=1 Tax=Stephania japonica TaxID=461633 RepID=A0AAP0P3H3_9MAGN